MLEAHDGLLQRVAVVEGAASVLRLADDVAFRVTRAKALETHGWTIAAGLADRDLVDKLDAVTALVLGPPEDPAVETDAINSSTGGQHKPSLVKRIRKALADDDVGLALDLVENEGAGFKDAEYLLAAADAYKQASQWTEAAQQYLAAYESANGKEAERALLRAAQIHLKNLGDPANAAALLDEYFERFPAGAYLDEAIYLAAVIQVRLGDDDQARSYYDEYLTLYPDGPQAVRVHIALARILALRFSDCPAALAHAAAAQSMAKGPEVEKQLAKVVTTCSVADTE
jgi:tetratricopeptide (TPR) repeat protein